MEERTFLLFKSDVASEDEMYRYIIRELRSNHLIIEREYYKVLSKEQICQLWPRLTCDLILYYTAIIQFKNAKRIIEIRGDAAVKKAKQIKAIVRSKFATNAINNCIHCPINYEEYCDHISVLHNDTSNYEVNFRELPYRCYSQLTNGLCRELANIIINSGLCSTIPYFSVYYNSTNKYRYYLIEDDIHTFTEYVCFLYDFFKQYTFQDATVLTMVLIAYGEVCIGESCEKNAIEKILNHSRNYNMTIKVHKIL